MAPDSQTGIPPLATGPGKFIAPAFVLVLALCVLLPVLTAAEPCLQQNHSTSIEAVTRTGVYDPLNAATLHGGRHLITGFVGPMVGRLEKAELQIVTTAIFAPVPVTYDFYLASGTTYSQLTNGPKVGTVTLGPGTASRMITVPLNETFLAEISAVTNTGPHFLLGATLSSDVNTNAYVHPVYAFLDLYVAATNAPVAADQSQDINFLEGENYSLQAPWSPCASYQWRLNDSDIISATNEFLILRNVALTNAGEYSVVIRNSFGAAASVIARATFPQTMPALNGPTLGFNAYSGENFAFCITVAGSPRPVVRWYREGAETAVATGPCLVFDNIGLDQAGTYTVVASNSVGTATSVLNLHVGEVAPFVSAPPHSVSVVEGGTVRLPIFAAGGPPPDIYLTINGRAVSLPDFTLLGATTNDAGEYYFVASNYLGTATSTVARIEVRPAGALDRWTARNPLPQVNTIQSIAAGPGRVVAVGEVGTILDAILPNEWTQQNQLTAENLRSVVFGGGRFVAVGSEGAIFSSQDGLNWLRPSRSHNTRLNAVAYGNGQFVAVGATGIFRSPDGLTWSRVAAVQEELGGVAYAGGMFVAGGRRLYYSTNAVDWLHLRATEYIESISHVNGQFVAVGDEGMIITSPDGTNWQPRSSGTTRRIYEVAYGNGKYVAVGARGNVLSSIDGVSWTLQNSGTPDRLEAVLFHGGMFIAAGENGTTITSPDGIVWTRQSFGTTRDLDGMVITPEQVVVVGKAGTILTSTNGVDFLQRHSGTTNNLHGVSWNTNIFVAVGEPGVILTSPDGVEWTRRESGVTNSLKRAHFGGNLWIAVGTEGTILRSPDGMIWHSVPRQTFDDLNDVSYGNGMFVIVGDNFLRPNGTLFSSRDGFNWTDSTINVGKNLRAISFADGKFVGTANDGRIIVSSDGTQWQFSFTGLPSNLRDVSWDNGVWTAVGNNGSIATSTDLRIWTQRFSRARENLHEYGIFRGRALAIGNRGTIIQSDRVSSARLAARLRSANIEVTGTAAGSARIKLQASSDLQTWTTIAINDGSDLFFEESLTRPEGKRFYRILED